MAETSKLKPRPWEWMIPLGIALILLIVPAIFFGWDGYYTVFTIIATLAAMIHFLVLLRTRNWGHLSSMLFYAFLCMAFWGRKEPALEIIGVVGACISYAFVLYTLFTKKINWRYDEILELAAKPVDKVEDGFTARPFPAGEAKYSKEDIQGFARFLIKHVIAMPYFEEKQVIMVVPRNMFAHLLKLRKNYREDTYVAFDYDGKISVQIAKKDYNQYKDELTFDQLCQSLGDLFKEFMRLFQQGQEKKIINILNAAKKGI